MVNGSLVVVPLQNNIHDEGRFSQVIAAIDAINAEGPVFIEVAGRQTPAELIYGQRMSETLARVQPNPSECLRIAARGQHIERWKMPRKSYPAGRDGYLNWRKHQRNLQAERLAGIMAEVGYGADDIKRVGVLIRKERLKADPEVQLFEDVICLVFLEHHIKEFESKVDEDKLADILAKTWKRMSEHGHSWALKLDLPPKVVQLLYRGLARSQAAE